VRLVLISPAVVVPRGPEGLDTEEWFFWRAIISCDWGGHRFNISRR
jgi:hypothetical protein